MGLADDLMHFIPWSFCYMLWLTNQDGGAILETYIPKVVPAECITYFSPDLSTSRWTSATWADTEAEPVPI